MAEINKKTVKKFRDIYDEKKEELTRKYNQRKFEKQFLKLNRDLSNFEQKYLS